MTASDRTPGRQRGQGPRALVVIAVVAAAVIAIAAALVGGRGPGIPLHPDSALPAGTKGLVETLRGLGHTATVSSTFDSGQVHSVLLIVDVLSDAQRRKLNRWVEDGGTLVVADPRSSLAPLVTSFAVLRDVPPGCDVEGVEDVARVDVPRTFVFNLPPGATGCFSSGIGAPRPSDEAFWLVEENVGGGRILSLGGAEALLNRNLDAADNAVLLVSLLAPRPATDITVIYPVDGSGELPPGQPLPEVTLGDLIPAPIVAALLQIAVAFGLFVLWRARRLGAPVTEPQPVALPGSQLVAASGALLQQAGARGAAADLLRDDLRRSIARAFGLPATAPAEALAAAVASRTSLAAREVQDVLSGRPPRTDGELVNLARRVDEVRTAALPEPHAHAGSSADQGARP